MYSLRHVNTPKYMESDGNTGQEVEFGLFYTSAFDYRCQLVHVMQANIHPERCRIMKKILVGGQVLEKRKALLKNVPKTNSTKKQQSVDKYCFIRESYF